MGSYVIQNTTTLTVPEIEAKLAELNYGMASKLPPAGFMAVVWTGIGIATFFLAARIWIRLTKIGRLGIDDFFVTAAWLFLLLNAILQTCQNPDIYNVTINTVRIKFYLSNELKMEPAAQYEFFSRGTRFLKYEFAIIGFFWTILWLVKASFLAFFYTLFDGLPTYRRMWWGVVVFAFFAYVGCWTASVNNCHPAYTYFTFGSWFLALPILGLSGACNKEVDRQSTVITIIYSTVVDILIDLMIMAMPLNLLWKVQISTRQKIGLAGVFSLGLIVIIFAIIRAVQVTATARDDTILLAFWGVLESTVAVVVGCLPPFKSLFGTPRNTKNGYGPSYGTGPGSRLRNGSMPLQSHATVRAGKDRKWKDDPKTESRESIVEFDDSMYPMQSIHVKKDVIVHSDERRHDDF